MLLPSHAPSPTRAPFEPRPGSGRGFALFALLVRPLAPHYRMRLFHRLPSAVQAACWRGAEREMERYYREMQS